MSGPKNYRYVLAAARRAQIQLRRAAERAARAQAVIARQEAQRLKAEREAQRAQEQRAKVRQQHAERANSRRMKVSEDLARERLANQHRDSIRRKSNLSRLEQAKASRKNQGEHTDGAELIADTPKSLVSNQETLSAPSVPEDELEELEISSDELSGVEDISTILQWREELAVDEDVKQYLANESGEWNRKAEVILSAYLSGANVPPAVSSAKDIVQEAQALHNQAGSLREQFNTRNELLADMISSLQETGFFVSDPQYEDSANPCGAVILRATRGGQSVVASIDLTDTIKSVWNGIEDNQCKDAFFRYVDQMKLKGVVVEPERADLRDRPQLLQVDAKLLPRGNREPSENQS